MLPPSYILPRIAAAASVRFFCVIDAFSVHKLVIPFVHIKQSVKLSKTGGFCFQFLLVRKWLLRLCFGMKWERNNRYKVLGRISNSAEGLILVFDLEEAIMFDALPEEYVDRKTGELKKRIKVYYPEKYEGRIGNYYHDYIATEQMNLFENLNEYDGGGNMQNGDNEAERNINQPSQFQNVTASGGELNE